MRIRPISGALGLLALLLPLGALQGAPSAGTRASAAAAADTTPRDPIAVLQARIDRGEVELRVDTALGYLPAILEELDIPVNSQGLVFSRTSLQTDKIAPWAPRAIYYNDDVYVAYVLGSDFLEIASVDPDGGTNFYTVLQHEAEKVEFIQETTACLMCHESMITDGVPGLIVLSTLSDRHGYPLGSVHDGTATDQTPFERRFGGWYVTGTHGDIPHAGNVYSPLLYSEVRNAREYRREFDLSGGGNLVNLEAQFHAEGYLSGHSDIVALMVLAHQTKVHNLISALHLAADESFQMEPGLRDGVGTEPGTGPRSRGEVRIAGAANRLVRAMLFSEEVALEGSVRGTTDFAETFSARGPHDSQGRSLRQLDLERRLFRYPLSFLIYTEAFDSLPEIARRAVYADLWTVLRSEDRSGHFDHLSTEDRQAILQILEETKPEFAELRAWSPRGPTAAR